MFKTPGFVTRQDSPKLWLNFQKEIFSVSLSSHLIAKSIFLTVCGDKNVWNSTLYFLKQVGLPNSKLVI